MRPRDSRPDRGRGEDPESLPRGGSLRILFVVGTLDIGGTEKQVVSLASGLNPARFLPSVCCLEHAGPLAEPLRAKDILVDEVPFRGLSALRQPLATGRRFRELVALVRCQQPAIVHTFLPHANVLGAMAARLAGIPRVVISLRGLDPPIPVWGRLAPRLADVVLTNAEAVREWALRQHKAPAAKVRVVRNGLSLCAFDQAAGVLTSGLPPGQLAIIVANPNRFKAPGLFVLVEAAERVVRRIPDARFLLAGDGPCLRQIEAAAASRGLADRFLCLGTRHDIPAILRVGRMAVLPSLEEGLPNAVLEAMAAGKPVVATRVGGTPEAVVHGETGLLVPPGDAQALSEAILTLLNDPARAEAMGQAGRERVSKCFSLTRMVRETEQIYEELLARRKERG